MYFSTVQLYFCINPLITWATSNSRRVFIFHDKSYRTRHDEWIRCNDLLKIFGKLQISLKVSFVLDCTAFSFWYEETEQSCGARRVFFYFSNTGRLPIVACREKDFLGERELCDILWVYMYLKVGTTHFIVWPYIIRTLGLTFIFWNPRSSNVDCRMVTWPYMVMPPY